MIGRREFLILASTAFSYPLTSQLFASSGRYNPFYRVIYDTRITDSLKFAEYSRKLGGKIFGIQGDIITVLDDGLYEQWQQRPVTIAGLTLYPAFYYLDGLARDFGHRVLYSAEHHYHNNGLLEHLITAPKSAMPSVSESLLVGSRWSQDMAVMMTRHEKIYRKPETQKLITETSNPNKYTDHLVSWVIGPNIKT